MTQGGIPLMRPKLPTAERILPYLARIDGARRYSNFGPLVAEFETRLAEHISVRPENIVCLSSGTAGLILALRQFDLPVGGRCAMPSWTFAATANAACAAGLRPWFLDVDAATWALDPAHVARRVAASPDPVAAIVVVAPFGARLDTAAWDRLSDELRLPVVIDAAASFDAVTAGRSPTIVSLHATKPFGVGEGGLVVSTDDARISRIRRDSNFGFAGAGRVATVGINAKLSEYAAAVGLAGLDQWPDTRAAYAARAERYGAGLAKQTNLTLAPNWREGRVTSTFNIDLGQPGAEALLRLLADRGIEARRWWSGGCHRHPAFADFAADALPVTENLASSVIGLPFYSDLALSEIDEVCGALAS